MQQYRCFFKDCFDLTGMPIANEVCTNFTINRDILSNKTSTFALLDYPGNIKEGDILGLVDPYGTIIYEGVINSISDYIETGDMISLFDDTWRWWDPSDTTIEEKIKAIIETDFVNSSDPLIQEKFPFTVTTTSSTSGTFEQHTYTKRTKVENEDGTTETVETEEISLKYTQNLMNFLLDLYDLWGVSVRIFVPVSGNPTITVGKPSTDPIKIGNNVMCITNLLPLTEIVETNKLLIYNDEGDTLRATYYVARDGITTDGDNPLRLPIVNTEYVFDTDTEISEIVEQQLQAELLNHKITFDLLIHNNLYNFWDWELGQTVELWYNEQYFNTIYTAFTLTKMDNQDITTVSVTCGKVRNKLTDIFSARGKR